MEIEETKMGAGKWRRMLKSVRLPATVMTIAC